MVKQDPNASCPSDAYLGLPVKPLVGTRSFHDIATYVSAACAILSVIGCFVLAWVHLFTYRVRREQRFITRIVILPGVIAAGCFFSVWFYSASGYIYPVTEYYDTFALCCLYLLLLEYATPLERRGGPIQLFNQMPEMAAAHGMPLSAAYRVWFSVFQIIPVRALTTIITLAIHGSLCKQLAKSKASYTIITVISTGSTVVCFLATIRFTRMIKASLGNRRPTFKLVALKGIVGIATTVEFIFNILKTAKAMNATDYMSLADWYIGVPNLITCCFSLVFTVLMIIPYNTKEFSAKALPNVPKKYVFVALLDVFNLSDVVIAIIKIPQAVSGAAAAKNGHVDAGTGGYGYKNEGTPMNEYEGGNVIPPPPTYGAPQRQQEY